MRITVWITTLFFFSCSAPKEEEQKNIVVDDLGLVIYNADSARNDFEKGNRRILVYGLRAPRLPQQVHDSLCKVYHFTEYEAAGCEVTDEFTKGVEVYNATMRTLLEELNGKGWQKEYVRLVNELDEVYRQQEEKEYRREDSLRNISEKFRKASDSLEAKNEKDAAVAYRKRMDVYKKQLEAEKRK